MEQTKLLLRAYYEALYELLESKKEVLATRIEQLLQEEIGNRRFGNFNEEKYAAYKDACLAFVDERIETYNPLGIQYSFDQSRTQEAFELELQLNWYGGREEYEALLEAAHCKAEADMTEERMRSLAKELIKEVGAYPDKSIISAYEAEPALGKLPDYVVARGIEEIINWRQTA